jgi:arabinogalactan endo-1,4-beta-galactosidase
MERSEDLVLPVALRKVFIHVNSTIMRWCILMGLLSASMACSDEKSRLAPPVQEYVAVRAADISSAPEIAAFGTQFFDANGQPGNLLDILKSNGCNTIRLRVWHSPVNGHSGFEEVAAFAQAVRAKGMAVWLAIHFSDTWADPGNQNKPVAWNSLSLQTLKDSVYAYTAKVVSKLHPEYVQLGNEINGGFLWPEGALENTDAFVQLLEAGIAAVRDEHPTGKIIIHYAGLDGAEDFYETLEAYTLDYDIIGLSYYPRWHTKDLNQVSAILLNLTQTFHKQLVIAETGYPFTLGWNDVTTNLVGLEEHLLPDFPATASGQRDFLLEMRRIISETEGGLGFCYWAPEWVAYKGTTSTNGSPWENMALFDFTHRALPGMEAFME